MFEFSNNYYKLKPSEGNIYDNSLVLCKVSKFEIEYVLANGKSKAVANFLYNNRYYSNMTVTDIIACGYPFKTGKNTVSGANAFIMVSLPNDDWPKEHGYFKYVSGITKTTAKKIIAYRDANGKITSREDLKKVPGLGPKAFEQCAGFLKIAESDEPLDNTWVHPENYAVAKEILPFVQKGEKLTADFKKSLCEKYNVGETTISDIAEELAKPNRDPRDDYPAPIMQKGVLSFDDLKVNMKVTGKIKNVVDFGAFVDIGLHETALIHISELSDSFVSDPMEVIKVGDVKEFTIIDLDKDRMRISLSLKSDAAGRTSGESSAKTSASSTGTTGKKRVVVVKKGASASASKPADRKPRERQNFGSDDGMYYNPFAALLKK